MYCIHTLRENRTNNNILIYKIICYERVSNEDWEYEIKHVHIRSISNNVELIYVSIYLQPPVFICYLS